MNFKTFCLEKVIPNFIIWFVAYVVLGKIVGSHLSFLALDWQTLVDAKALIVFMLGVISAIVIAWLAANGMGLPWLLKKMREEASSALVNFSSIALIVGGASFDAFSIILGLFGFIIAWRIP